MKKVLKIFVKIMVILAVNVVLYIAGVYLFKLYDSAWDNRACNAGYYNTMDEGKKNPNFECKK